jgi:hypothetical protein
VSATPAAICSNQTAQLSTAFTAPAMTASVYGFSSSTGASLDPMTGATEMVPAAMDGTVGTPAAIGFDFPFEGVSYSRFAASPDGWVRFGDASFTGVPSSQGSNSLVSTTNVPKIAPFWDDHGTGSNGSVKYLVDGTAPNRILKVQWQVAMPWSTTVAYNTTFQAWLYETSGKIEYRYGTMATAGSASIGLSGRVSPPTRPPRRRSRRPLLRARCIRLCRSRRPIPTSGRPRRS